MSYQTRIQVLIREQTPYGEFNDAIYFTQEEYATKTEEDITALKDERVNNFVSAVSNPPKVEEPTPEDLQTQKESLLKQIQDAQIQVSEIEDKIDLKKEVKIQGGIK